MERRALLKAGAATALLAPAYSALAASRRSIVGDYSGLGAVPVAEQHRPRTAAEVSDLVSGWPGAVSVGGDRYSMGGRSPLPTPCTWTCAA